MCHSISHTTHKHNASLQTNCDRHVARARPSSVCGDGWGLRAWGHALACLRQLCMCTCSAALCSIIATTHIAAAPPHPLQLLAHFWELAALEEVRACCSHSLCRRVLRRCCGNIVMWRRSHRLAHLLPETTTKPRQPPRPSPPCLPLQEARQKGASALVAILVKDQRDFEAESGAEQSGDEDEQDAAAERPPLGAARAHDVDRALRRCSPLMVHKAGRPAGLAPTVVVIVMRMPVDCHGAISAPCPGLAATRHSFPCCCRCMRSSACAAGWGRVGTAHARGSAWL